MNNKNKPLKITVKHWNREISVKVGHSDLTLEELHDLWIDIVRAMGYAEGTIKEYYEQMSKLIWRLYNENIISLETATILLDKHYEQTTIPTFGYNKFLWN